MAATKTTKKKQAATTKSKGGNWSAAYAKPLLIALGVVIIVGTVWFVLVARHNANAALLNSQKSSQGTKSPMHSNNEAIKAAAALYRAYLPLKAQTVADVGNNPNVEPANVQVVRASEVYFTKSLYNDILKDYMTQYQQ
ncbi:MAG TPA: hypothetical protein VFH39_02995, partial [Candidatus Saccharimonadales bacterium]|nr:hypothetical protein [Candidatus Saccharimonadales bacterium]